MFYSQFILAKKGPLGTIWIAAHLERKLRKNQVADTDIGTSVDSIIFPEVPIALRLSSHLLLGVVKIYSKKVNYLFDDCSEALLKIKQAFRSAAVDLPPEESTAPYHSITLPETFDLDDFELPVNELFQSNCVDHHVSTREQITLQDTLVGVAYGTSQYGLDERFGDGDVSHMGLDIDEDLFGDKVLSCGVDGVVTNLDADAQATVQPMTPHKNDEINEGTTDVSDAMTDECSRVQMQCTPMIMDLNEVADTPVTAELMNNGSVSDINGIFGCDDAPNFGNISSPDSPFPTNNENSFSSTDFQDDISDSNHPHTVRVSTEENNMPLFKTTNNPHGDFNISADRNIPFLFQQEITSVNNTMCKSSLYFSGQVKMTDLQSENKNGCFHGVQIDMNNDSTLNNGGGRYIPNDNEIAGASSLTHDASGKQGSIFEVVSGKSGSESNSCPFSEGILSKDHVSSTPVATNFRPTAAHLGEHYSAMNDLVSTDVGVVATHGSVELRMNDTQTCREPGNLFDVKSCSSYVSTSHSVNMNEVGSALPFPFPRLSTVFDADLQKPFVSDISSMAANAQVLDKPCEFASGLISDSARARTQNHTGILLGNSAHDCPRQEDCVNKMVPLGVETITKDIAIIDELPPMPAVSNDSGIGSHKLKLPFVNSSTFGEVWPSKVVPKSTFSYYESHGDVGVLKNGAGVCTEATNTEISNPFAPRVVSNDHVHVLQPCSSQQDTLLYEVKNSVNMSVAMPTSVRRSSLVEYGEESVPRFSEKNPSILPVASRDFSVVEKHVDNEVSRESYADNTDRRTEFDAPEMFLSAPTDIQKFPFFVGDSINGLNLEGHANVSTNVALNSGKMQSITERFQTPQTPVFTAISESIIMDRENMLDFSAPALTISDTGYLTSTSNDFNSSMIISGRKHDPIKTISKSARHSDIFFSSRTAEIMGDEDDLLSSILVGKRSLSTLKLKPPPSEVAPCKRIRLTPRASSFKRKAIVDDTIILHGDAMRHQLTSTEDIRRARKKAPYTPSEIMLTHRQYMEEEIFDEPTCTGMTSELYNLNNSNMINVAVIDANTPPVKPMIINSDMGADHFTTSENGDEINNPVQTTCLLDRNVNNTLTAYVESAVLMDSCTKSFNSICGVNDLESCESNPLKHSFTSLGSSGKSDDILRAINVSIGDGNTQILQSVETTNYHMKSDACPSGIKASVSDVSGPSGRSLESMFVFTGEDDVDCATKRHDKNDTCVEVQPMMLQHTKFQSGEVNTGTKMNTEPHVYSSKGEDVHDSPIYRQHGIQIDGRIQNVELTSAVFDAKNLCECDMVHQSTDSTLFEKVDLDSLAPTVISSAQTVSHDSVMDLNGNEASLGGFKCTENPSFDPPREQNDCITAPICADLGNEGSCVTADMACEIQQLDGLNSLSGDREKGIFQDRNSGFVNNVNDINPSASYVVECETRRENDSIENGENSNCQVTTTDDVNLGSTTTSPTVPESDAGVENLIFEQDTDFLKRDYDCYIEGTEPTPEEIAPFENSGWSSRTRAVAKYLQSWFCNEVGQARMSLPLNGILSGKTRKEASRMFFETLVLKSRDYVEVEQEEAFGKIEIKAGEKLMKDDNRGCE